MKSTSVDQGCELGEALVALGAITIENVGCGLGERLREPGGNEMAAEATLFRGQS